MNEILENNFNENFLKLENDVKNASFIAIDAEFTGIQSGEDFKYSLFDTVDIRYQNIKNNIQPFVIIQCGIATFQHVPRENRYNVQCYNFYLMPRSVPYNNRQFSWQVAALEFLSANKFDFGKFANSGISYLDEIDEKLLKQHLDEGNLSQNMEHLSYEEEDDFKDCKNKVFNWLKRSPNQVSLEIKTASPILQYMVHRELRSRFNNIWTVSGCKSVTVLRVSKDIRSVLEKEEGGLLEKGLLDCYIGFSKVFKLLTDAKKPIVGHNVFLDLMFIHKQFYRPLPNKYIEFKNNIHTLFPQIYDTKFMSIELKKVLNKDANWKINSLSHIYEYFTLYRGKYCIVNSPAVQLENDSLDEHFYHNAGWDAYYAGYIFIKMGFLFTIGKYGKGLADRTVTHTELMSAIKGFANSINVIRGNETYLKLDGDDPSLTRSEWLHVKLKSPSLDVKEVAVQFSSFGPVDVMPFARKRVLVAVANHRSALNILNHFKNNTELQVARYNPIRHAPPSRVFLWSGIVLSGGMIAWMMHRIFKKSVTLN
ncbi:pre-piRNA 3'-exonuclease trimmer-like [Hylaeus volcanicus]|uniref:pre-piRNA 3'-exonuclease trimmer-like n=1 Tax=Hylaeus volcanicus TaxID=313075 RepID=UPI0023B7A50A|nr:pre-piRNA 3'-exonuclease trimmer-like [Hylaeus volcanicus]